MKGYIRLLLFIYSNYDEIARLSFYCIVIVQETIEVQCNFGKGKWIRVKYSNSKFPKLIKEQGAFLNDVSLRVQYFKVEGFKIIFYPPSQDSPLSFAMLCDLGLF